MEHPQYYSPHYSDIETDLHSSEYDYQIINCFNWNLEKLILHDYKHVIIILMSIVAYVFTNLRSFSIHRTSFFVELVTLIVFTCLIHDYFSVKML